VEGVGEMEERRRKGTTKEYSDSRKWRGRR
jgi:hypothetical protein